MRRYLIALALIISSGTMNAQSLDDAIKMYKYERYGTAKTYLTPLAATNALANYYLGLSELGSENISAAKAIFQKYPDDPANNAGLARVMFLENNPQEAMAMLNKVASKARKKDYLPLKYAADAITYTEGGDPNVAIQWYKKAMEIEKTGDLHMALGDAYRKIQGGGGDAMTNYEYAEGFANSKSMANYKMGNLWYAAKNYDSALVKYARASELDASNPLPYNDLANAYNKIGKYAKAKENIEKYLPLSDNAIDDQIRYANVLYLSKNYRDAIAKMNELIAKGAEKPYMYRVMGFSQYELKEYPAAQASMDKFFAKQDPKKIIPLDYYYQGKIYLRDTTKRALANEQFLKAIGIDTTRDLALTYRGIAEAYFDAEDYANSAIWYKKIVDANYPGLDERDYWWAGYMSYYANDMATSEQMFTKYNQLNPTEPLSVLWLARLTEKAKDKDFKNGLAEPYYQQWLTMVKEDDAAKKKDFIKAYTYLAMVAYNKNDKENAKKYAEKLQFFNPADDTAKQILKALSAMK